MEKEISIQRFIVKDPKTIDIDNNLKFALGIMHEYNIRHLPVVDKIQVRGILTLRDIRLVQSLDHEKLENISVEEVFIPDVYKVEITDPLEDVCYIMAENRFSCALVMKQGDLVGIFTWIDALKVLGDIISKRP